MIGIVCAVKEQAILPNLLLGPVLEKHIMIPAPLPLGGVGLGLEHAGSLAAAIAVLARVQVNDAVAPGHMSLGRARPASIRIFLEPKDAGCGRLAGPAINPN